MIADWRQAHENLQPAISPSYCAQERAELIETSDDNRPLAPDEIAGPTLFSLVSPGTELANYTGLGGKFPIRPGYAAVFKIEKAGAEVKDLAVGSAVFCIGPHASRQRCRRQDVVLVPVGLSPETAPFCRLMGVSMSTLTTTRARPPAQVLVTGLGPVGHLAAQVFAACGYRVTGCDPVESRRALLEQKGIGILPAVPLNDPRFQDQVELVVECSGHEQAALDACRLVRWRVRASAWVRHLARGGETLIAAAENGLLLQYDLQGNCTGSLALGGEIQGLWAWSQGVIALCGDGQLRCFEL